MFLRRKKHIDFIRAQVVNYVHMYKLFADFDFLSIPFRSTYNYKCTIVHVNTST